MTLRGVVLFPHAMLPLRIFEDRYKKMLSDVLKKDRMFAVVAQREKCDDESSEEPPFEVATIGLVRVSKKNPDGTSFVMLQGVSDSYSKNKKHPVFCGTSCQRGVK